MNLRLEIPHLRAFVTVSDEGSFTRAAERLHLTQSAVSWQVKRLEERIGNRLLFRGTEGVAPTLEGCDLLKHAREILSAHDDAVAHLRKSDIGGRVRFGCAEDMVADSIAEILGRFRRGHPNIRLEIVVDTSIALDRRVGTGELDAALLQRPSGQDGGTRLWQEQPLWIAREGAVFQRDRPLPMVTFGESCVYRRAAVRELEVAGVDWYSVLEAPSVASVRAALLAGIGVGILAERHLVEGLHPAALDWLPALPANDFVLVGRAGQLNPAIQALAGEVETLVAERKLTSAEHKAFVA